MFVSVSHFFSVLAFLDLTLAVLCCILLIKVSARYAIKFVTIPLVILGTYVLLIQGEDILGRAYDKRPVGQFEFVDYRVDVKDGVKKIELWIIQDKKSRLHIIDYNENTEQELSKAKTRKNKGLRQRGQFGEPTDKEGSGKESLAIGDIPLAEILPPKDGEESEKPTAPAEPEPDKSLIERWKFKT